MATFFVDTNFPTDSVARQTVIGRLLRLENVTPARGARAILSAMPLDSLIDEPVSRMEIIGKPDETPPVYKGGISPAAA
jgi:L-fucose mutarotase